jgi:hypothetical protein
MKLSSFSMIVEVLNQADVRYLVAGGLAVNAHGYLRYTKDADLVLQLNTSNIVHAFDALAELGYKPSVPITAKQFANEDLRKSWIRDKGMTVLQLWSDRHIETPIDLFVAEPFEFDREYDNALVKALYGTTRVRFVSLPTLLRLKSSAGRAQDLADIDNLRIRLESGDE